MEKAPVADEGYEPLECKTWTLRVPIHCEGCKKKVKKVLQSIEGVYKTDIDSKQHKVIIVGSIDAETLIKKLVKSRKHAELWPESEGNSPQKSKKKEVQKGSKDVESTSEQDEKGEAISPAKDNLGNVKEIPKDLEDTSGDNHPTQKSDGEKVTAQSGCESGGNGGKKKKKKKKKNPSGPVDGAGENGGPGGPMSTRSPLPAANIEPSLHRMNMGPQQENMFSSYPQFYFSAPAYGMSYNTAPTSVTPNPSHYSLPIHSYAYMRPEYYAPHLPSDHFYPPSLPSDHFYSPALPSDRVLDSYGHNVYRDTGNECSIM